MFHISDCIFPPLSHVSSYKDFPTYALENTMAGTPEKMRTFLYDLYEKLRESGKKEIQMLTDFKHECGEEGELEAWDYSYYISKLKEKLYQVGNDFLNTNEIGGQQQDSGILPY